MSTVATTRPHLQARTATSSVRRRPGPAAIEAVGLVALIATAVALRLALAGRSLWFDELITVLKARDTVPSLLTSLTDDVHPPLFYVLLHVWLGAFGTGAVALRSLSIAWSAVAVAAVWAWSREAFPGRTGLPAAALAALAPFSAWYGSEIRMYSQLLALTALAGWLTWRTLARGPRPGRIAALTAVLTALAYTHYFASLFVGALGVVAAAHWRWRREARVAATWVMATCAIAWASLLPWLAFVHAHRSAASPDPTRYPVPDFYSVAIAGLEMLVGFPSFSLLGVLAAGWPLLCLLAMVLLPRTGRVPWRASGLLAVAGLPAAVLVAFSLFGPRSVFDPRFLAVCAVPLYVLGGRLLTDLRGRTALVLGTLLAVCAVGTGVWQNTSHSNPKLYDYAGAISAINRHARPGDAILLLPNFAAAGEPGDPVFDYYPPKPGLVVADTHGVGQVSAQRTGQAMPAVWEHLRRMRPGRVFVIDAFSRQARSEAAAATAAAFIGARARRSGQLSFANAGVTVYRTPWRSR